VDDPRGATRRLGQAEASAVVFREQADGRERAQQPVEQCRVGADPRRQSRRIDRAILEEMVEYP